MSSTIKKVIKVSYEQYHDLLTKGKTIDKDGNEHLYDNTASYNVYGYDELMALNNKIDNVLIKPYKITHTPIIVENLETYINNLYAEKGYTDSYAGLIGLMKKGDTIHALEGCDVYINGSKIDYDYTYTENDTELVTICVFATTGNIILTEDNFQMTDYSELYVNRKGLDITFDSSTIQTVSILTDYGLALPGSLDYSNIVKFKGDKILASSRNNYHCQNLKEVEYLGTQIPSGAFTYAQKLEKASFPNVVDITGGGYNTTGAFNHCDNENLVLKFPKLTSFATRAVSDTVTFDSCKYVELPETLEICNYMNLLTNTKNIVLNCINCVFYNDSISSYNSPYTEYLKLAEGWNTNINIKHFINLSIDNIIENFNNLKDLTGENTKTITIPQIIYNALTEEQKSIATNKNWTLGYA